VVDKIKHICIVLIFPTKSVFKYKKKHAVHNINKLAWGSNATVRCAHALRWQCPYEYVMDNQICS